MSQIIFDKNNYFSLSFNMVKKINEFGATVHTLLKQGYSQSWIAHQLKVKRQGVNYWASHPLKTQQFKKKIARTIYQEDYRIRKK